MTQRKKTFVALWIGWVANLTLDLLFQLAYIKILLFLG